MDLWLQEIQHCPESETDAINAPKERSNAYKQARQLVNNLSPKQALAKIRQVKIADQTAAQYRATPILHQAFNTVNTREDKR